MHSQTLQEITREERAALHGHYFKVWNSYHAKIANRRKDALHQFTRQLVNHAGEIYVGHVKSSSLTQTQMAKSVLDSGWAIRYSISTGHQDKTALRQSPMPNPWSIALMQG